MTQPGVFTPYSSVSSLLGNPQSWVPADDQQRIGSYEVYDRLYWNQETNIQLLTRSGLVDQPLIVPSPMIVVETINRYVGAHMRFQVDQDTGTPETRSLAQQVFTDLFARERFYSKYNANKRFGILRGDWMFHVLADPNKPAGTKLRILPVDPASYFAIEDPNDPDRLLGCHLVEQIVQGDDTFVKRQTYRRVQDGDGNFTGEVTTETTLWKPDEWFLLDKSPVQTLLPLASLPAGISSLPVYHIPNFCEPGHRFGSSEIRGFERLMAGINGSITDEDVTLALEGLGVYFTENGKPPIDRATGQEVEWDIFPGKVVQGTRIERVDGIKTVVPFGDHVERLMEFLKQASGTTDAAIGHVDVQVAESGVALLLHFSPTLSKAEEKDQIISDVLSQMFFDLRAWLRVYEGINIDDVMIRPVFGDKLPTNTKSLVELVTMMMSTVPPIISARTAREYLATRGGLADVFAEDEAERIAAEQAQVAQWSSDTADARAAAELAGELSHQDADGTGTQTDGTASEG